MRNILMNEAQFSDRSPCWVTHDAHIVQKAGHVRRTWYIEKDLESYTTANSPLEVRSQDALS